MITGKLTSRKRLSQVHSSSNFLEVSCLPQQAWVSTCKLCAKLIKLVKILPISGWSLAADCSTHFLCVPSPPPSPPPHSPTPILHSSLRPKRKVNFSTPVCHCAASPRRQLFAAAAAAAALEVAEIFAWRRRFCHLGR